MWFFGWEPLTLSQHRALFGVHGFSASGDIMYLICHVTSHDYPTKRSCEFVGGSSFWYVITLIRLVAFSIVMVDIRF